MSNQPQNGIVTLPSAHTVTETVSRLGQILESKGVKLFALIDHSGEAQKAGLHMPDTKLLIFGNPKAGTPLMLAVPTIAIDLPLKILVWQDSDARTWVTYNSPEFLASRHALPPELTGALAAAAALATQITQ